MALITPTEAAKRLGDVPVSTLAQWRYRKVGPPYVKVGAHVKYDPDQLDAYIRAHTVQTTPIGVSGDAA